MYQFSFAKDCLGAPGQLNFHEQVVILFISYRKNSGLQL